MFKRSLGLGINQRAQIGTLLNQKWLAYKQRVLTDLGLIRDESLTKKYFDLLKNNNIPEPVVCLIAEAGVKPRVVSAIQQFATKVYSLFGTNDATQTTAASQLYLKVPAAPNERASFQNPNGDARFMTHPTVSFGANEAWTVQILLNANGSNTGTTSRLLGNDTASKTRIEIAPNGGTIYVYGETANGSLVIPNIKGKNKLLSVAYNGSGTCSIHIGSTLIGTIAVNSAFIFNTVGRASTGQYFYGESKKIGIYMAALTPTQISLTSNFWSQYYPEIPTVQIGSQTWATSNFEAVATPMGNLIANVTDNTAWANSTATYDSVYVATAGTVEQKTYAAVKAAAMWSYYNNASSLGAVYGKLYNWYAVKLLQMDIDYYNTANPTTPWGYRVPTDTDFNNLATALGGASVAGGKMKKEGTLYFSSPNTGADNSSGFSGTPNGYRRPIGTFAFINTNYYAYGITEIDAVYVRYVELLYNSVLYNSSGLQTKDWGFSLRLIKS